MIPLFWSIRKVLKRVFLFFLGERVEIENYVGIFKEKILMSTKGD